MSMIFYSCITPTAQSREHNNIGVLKLVLLCSGVATQYTALGFLHEMPPPFNTVVKVD